MDTNDVEFEAVNQVLLRGRLAVAPVVRELPSGDTLVTFRLTVPRPVGERVRVDSLDCVTLRARAQRALERCEPGDVVEVSGSLQRRFWRSAAGPSSRYAVAVDKVTPVRRSRRRTTRQTAAASPSRKQASA